MKKRFQFYDEILKYKLLIDVPLNLDVCAFDEYTYESQWMDTR